MMEMTPNLRANTGERRVSFLGVKGAPSSGKVVGRLSSNFSRPSQTPVKVLKAPKRQPKAAFGLSEKTVELVKKARAKVSTKQVTPEQSPAQKQPDPGLVEQARKTFQDLAELIPALDDTINVLKFQKLTPFLSEIQRQLPGRFQRMISVTPVSQIIAQVELYSFEWGICERSDNYELILRPQAIGAGFTIHPQEIQARKELFVQKTQHFLARHSEDLAMGRIQIPTTPLPPRPNRIVPTPLASHLGTAQASRPENLGTKVAPSGVLQRLKELGVVRQSLQTAFATPAKGLSQTEKADELRQRILTEVSKNETRVARRIDALATCRKKQISEGLASFAGFLHIHFKQRNVSNMFLTKLLTYAAANYRRASTEAEILESIQGLCQEAPEWLSLVDNPAGKIVRMNHGASFLEIEAKLSQLNL